MYSRLCVVLAVMCVFVLAGVGVPDADVPHLVSFQGMLTDANGPVSGPVDITFGIYGSVDGSDLLWEEVQGAIPVTNGLYHVLLGNGVKTGGAFDFDPTLFNSVSLWLQVSVGNPPVALSGRQRITSVMSAFRAEEADRVAPGSVNLSSLDPTMCQEGEMLVRTGSAWACGQLASDILRPVALLDLLTTNGNPLPNNTIGWGQSFRLGAHRSYDMGGGTITNYRWRVDSGSGNSQWVPLTASPYVTTVPEKDVIASPSDPFAVGDHVFMLQVTDNAGNASRPVYATVHVVDTTAPVAVLNLLSLAETALPGNQIGYGLGFILQGKLSYDAGGGQVAQWEFTRLSGSGGTSVFPLNTPIVPVPNSYEYVVLVPTADPLNVGTHVFQLRVSDNSGNVSQPVQATLTVLDTVPPTAVARALNASGAVVPPNEIRYGQDFILDGSQSHDADGSVVRWRWTRLPGYGDGGESIFPLGSTIETDSPELVVSASTDNFAEAEHWFSLVVEDDSGNISAPVEVSIYIWPP